MKAVVHHTPLPIEDERSLVDVELPEPTPGPRDLLVEVRAVSVNPVDYKLRASAPVPPGDARVLGFDAAGVVVRVGSEVTRFRSGDEVFYAGAIDRPGSNAQFQAVDERIVGHKPRGLDFGPAAALPLTAITAWEILFDRLAVKPDEQDGTLLVINGAGGVGSILTQLARALTGLTVIATASRPESAAWCRAMGAHHVVDHHASLPDQIRALNLPPVLYVASLTATDRHLPAIADVIAPQGHLALIDDPEQLDIVSLKRKSVSVHWEMMFTRSLYHTADMGEQGRLLDEVAKLVEAGRLRTTMTDEAGPITALNLRRAHAHQESGRAIGKTVLTGFPA